MLRNFEEAPTPTFIPKASTNRHLYKAEADWGGRELHDYVTAQLSEDAEQTSHDSYIFKSFLKRWKEKAVPIARFAFEVSSGRWHGKPVAPAMFQKSYDPYFAEVIARLLENR